LPSLQDFLLSELFFSHYYLMLLPKPHTLQDHHVNILIFTLQRWIYFIYNLMGNFFSPIGHS
jgi:hypothetical protein